MWTARRNYPDGSRSGRPHPPPLRLLLKEMFSVEAHFGDRGFHVVVGVMTAAQGESGLREICAYHLPVLLLKFCVRMKSLPLQLKGRDIEEAVIQAAQETGQKAARSHQSAWILFPASTGLSSLRSFGGPSAAST